MKSNYKGKVEAINEFDNNLKEAAVNAPTLESRTALTSEEILGDNFVKIAREKIGADSILLTEEMISAELHLELVKKCMDKLLRTEKYKENEIEIRNISIEYLCASICKALASRVKNIKFSSYANIDYYQKHVNFLYKANNEKIRLLSQLGLM